MVAVAAVAENNKQKQERVTYFVLLFSDLKIPIFDVKWLFFLSQCYYQIWRFDDVYFF